MSSAQIGRLKNTGLTEKQILERINSGVTDAAGQQGSGFPRGHAQSRQPVSC